MWMFAYVITVFLVFVAGSIYGARAEKAARDAAVAELNRLKAKIVEVAAKRV